MRFDSLYEKPVLFALAAVVVISIGTLVTTGVRAAKEQTAAPDATTVLLGISIRAVMMPATTSMSKTTGPISALPCERTLSTTYSPSDSNFFEIPMPASCQTRWSLRRKRDVMPVPDGMRQVKGSRGRDRAAASATPRLERAIGLLG